jgi:AraC-like DNA-binding protein
VAQTVLKLWQPTQLWVLLRPPAATVNTVKIQNGLQAALQAAGVDPAVLLRKSGLPLTLWSSGRGMVTVEQGFALWRAIGELSDDPGIGLKLPGLIPKEQHHPVTIAAQHARTFRDGLQRFARYKLLICGEEMRLTERKEECIVEFTRILSREFAPPQLVDAVFASTLEIGRRGTGQPLHPLRVELRRNPAHREIHEAHYGCRVKFKAPRNAIVFRTADLDRPFTSYNAELLAMLGGQLERELAERKVWQTTVAARVKWILLRLLGGQSADLGEVAKDLGMSNRTLQRRITSEGTSFRRLVRDARYELAKHYLLDPSLDLAETAYLLGYEDPNSFFRAFREWEGTTPSEWRAAQRGQSVENEQSRFARPIRQLSA